jgi:hypothetical protein
VAQLSKFLAQLLSHHRFGRFFIRGPPWYNQMNTWGTSTSSPIRELAFYFPILVPAAQDGSEMSQGVGPYTQLGRCLIRVGKVDTVLTWDIK